MIRKKIKKICKLLICVISVLLTGIGGVRVYAAQEKGSITIQLENIGTPMENVEFWLYPVAGLSDDGKTYWVMDGRLSDPGVNRIRTSKESQAAAGALAAQISDSGITGTKAVTDASGIAVREDLDPGLYLIIQKEQSSYGTVAPFLSDLPQKQESGWSYEAAACPKGQKNGTTLPGPDKPVVRHPVKTDDAAGLGWYTGLLLISGLLCVVVIKQRRSKR